MFDLALDPALADLASLDPLTLPEADRVSGLLAIERHRHWVDALEQRWLVAVAGTLHDTDDWGREEVAAALRLSCATAQRRIDVARSLTARLAATGRALAAGTISYWHAASLAEAVEKLDPATTALVEARVLAKAAGQTVAEFRRSVRTAVLACDPVGAEERHERAKAQRHLAVFPGDDAMAFLDGYLPADGAVIVKFAVDAYANLPGVDRSLPIEARRTDGLVQICQEALDRLAAQPAQQRKRARARRPEGRVTISLETLMGLGSEPAQLTGYGAVPTSVAMRCLEGAEFRRFVTDPLTGELLDRSPSTYALSDDLDAFLIERHQTCGFPGCGQPAWRCEMDHATKHRDGGPTNRENCGPLCKRHHRLKHEADWQLQRHPNGTWTWTSKAGHTYEQRPPPL